MKHLIWELQLDQANNTVWESEVILNGKSLKYRIFQRFTNNRITYVEDSDYELWLDRRERQIWFDIFDAKYDMNRANIDIIKT